MGSVWEGLHVTLGTRVAIKFIESQYIHNREARQRFENEARAAAALHSRHVVQVFDHGLMEDGRPYIVMEFLSGEPLDRRLERVGCLGPLETARLVVQVCRALSKAHQAGIIHRDLKPENIFLVWEAEENADVAKVVDFGIAKFAENNTLASATRTGSVLGTPYYMSPEQARGLRTVDHRSDLWSVGVIAYQCLVGRLPFQGESVGDLLVTICTGTLPIPSHEATGLSPAFDAWFARALARSPDARFPSAGVLAESLCEAMGISMQSESWGTAASRMSSGIMAPSLISAGVTQVTPGSVTVAAPPSSPPPKRVSPALIALAAVPLIALSVFAGLKLSSVGGQAAAATPPTENAVPPRAATVISPAATATDTAAAPKPAEPAAAPSVAAPAEPAAVAPRTSSPARTQRSSRPTSASASKARPVPAEPAETAAEPPPPPPKAPEPVVPSRPAKKPSIDIDLNDPWRK